MDDGSAAYPLEQERSFHESSRTERAQKRPPRKKWPKKRSSRSKRKTVQKVRRRNNAGLREEQFLRVLEKLLLRIIRSPDHRGRYHDEYTRPFAETLWMSRWIGDPEASLITVQEQHSGVMFRLHEALYDCPASTDGEAPFILCSGKPWLPTNEAIFVWGQMRHRMLRAESDLGKYLHRRFKSR